MVTISNEKYYEDKSKNYEKIFKKFLKSIPNSILKEHLIRMKIIKEDYLTKECKFKEKKKCK